MDYPIIDNRRCDRGRTFEVGIMFTNGLVPTEMHLSCKKQKTDETYIFHKTIGDGVALNDDGYWRCVANTTDTDIAEGTYYYDVTVEKGTSKQTLVKGELQITTGVTE